MRSENRPARPRLTDVAKAAGVSTTTVSLVLNGKAGANIPAETQARVRAAAASLEYRPNVLARGLRRQRSDTIGVISDELATAPYATPMLQGAQDAAWAAGHLLLLVNTGWNVELRERAIEVLLDRQVDGVIVATMAHQIREPIAALSAVPAVLLDNRATDRSLPSVVPDEVGGARAAVERLVAAGHRRIGYVTTSGPLGAAAGLRLDGYQQTLSLHGIEYDPGLVVLRGDGDAKGGIEAGGSLLDLPDPPTAIFCFNDRMAMGVYRAARYRGLRIGEDVSIIGYDDAPDIAAWLDPPLTSVALPHYEMGHWAVQVLLDRVAGAEHGDGEAPQHLASCPLVDRESVGPPRRG